MNKSYIIPVVILLVLYGCATSPASRFYLLDSGNINQDFSVVSNDGDRLIGIGPVRFPDYLDRPQIVSRSSDNELVLSDTHRWAEPLEENFTRILAEHLSRLLGTSAVTVEPSRNRTSLKVRIIIDVIRFDAGDNGNIHLDSYWSVENGDGSLHTPQRRSSIRITGSRNMNYPAIVRGMSDAVSRLAGEIAVELAD